MTMTEKKSRKLSQWKQLPPAGAGGKLSFLITSSKESEQAISGKEAAAAGGKLSQNCAQVHGKVGGEVSSANQPWTKEIKKDWGKHGDEIHLNKLCPKLSASFRWIPEKFERFTGVGVEMWGF